MRHNNRDFLKMPFIEAMPESIISAIWKLSNLNEKITIFRARVSLAVPTSCQLTRSRPLQDLHASSHLSRRSINKLLLDKPRDFLSTVCQRGSTMVSDMGGKPTPFSRRCSSEPSSLNGEIKYFPGEQWGSYLLVRSDIDLNSVLLRNIT